MAPALKLARPTRGSPTQKVNKNGFPICKLFFRQNYVDVSSFRNVYLPERRVKILWSPIEGQVKKNIFPTALNNLSDSNNGRSRDIAVLGVVNATESKQKSQKGDSHICRPSEEDTPLNFVPFCGELEVELATKFHRFLRSGKH